MERQMTRKELNMENIAFDASIEINGVAMILAGLANQLDNEVCDSLTPDSLDTAIYAVRMHLERIADDLENIVKKASVNT